MNNKIKIYFIRHSKLDLPYENHLKMPYEILDDLATSTLDPSIAKNSEKLFLDAAKDLPLKDIDIIYFNNSGFQSKRSKESALLIGKLLKERYNKEVPILGNPKLKEIDLFHQLLSILYNPNYLKLYVYILLKSVKIENIQDLIEDKKIKQDVVFLLEKIITKDIENKKFPVFINNIDFIFWWSRRIFPNLKLTSSIKIKHLVFFFYMKYSYVFLNKLVFKHQWYLN